ncbi:protein translocase subunit SecD [Thermomonospora umbrina]|uniref:Protein translocase subunit SecD n=1 Tax=Thermomonospora umbrina TaxID=111806 RepID=A0A3D9SG68_9ACTN|nr:protein translocase subunit SecD [Thermomonospora umbrina]REE94677.1 preprotein translocase subunit SecD [Thermomonospora umbrina]
MASPSTSPRPGRTILLLFAVLAVLTGVMFLQEQPTPKLALDLAGGTTVTLTAVTESGANPPGAQMQQAVTIIRDRVNGLGVSEAEVSRQGDNHIVVQVPGTEDQRRIVDLIGTTAQLQFRQVYALGVSTPRQAPTPGSPPTPTSSRSPAGGPSPTPSATARPRALSAALAAPSPSPSGSGGSGAPSPSPSTSIPPDPRQQWGGQDFSGIEDPAVIAQFQSLDCTRTDRKAPGADDPRRRWVAACDQDGAGKYILGPVRVEGREVSSATAVPPNVQEGQTSWSVQLDFKSRGGREFGRLTADAYRQYQVSPSSPRRQIAIVLDGQVVSAPEITRGAIQGGTASIDGPPDSFNQTYATDLANVLKYGALPLKFEKSSIETVSSTLGSDQLEKGLQAGALGLVLVVAYSLLYYRGLGLVSVAGLAVAAAITYLSVVLLGSEGTLGFRLSLAHVIGLIVSIGIAADSFIVYFERLRDELREGRQLRPAVESAWKRARRTILVADAVMFIGAAVLYLLAVGGVKGFAFAIGLTTLIDVLVVFLFTKPMVAVLARRPFFAEGHKWSGLDPERLRKTGPAPSLTKEA